MKALIRKRGNIRGKYYHGKTLKGIVNNFIKSNSNLVFIKLWEFSNRYEIQVMDLKRSKGYDLYDMPKDKIIK